MFLTIFVIICFIAVVALLFSSKSSERSTIDQPTIDYTYKRKQFIMTQAENTFLRALRSAIGNNYEILPQVHLATFLDHKVNGQNWMGAKSKIDRKSVDFLICSKGYYNPLVAVELDDASHSSPKRVARDAEVDAYMASANMPIVHIKWRSTYSVDEIRAALATYLDVNASSKVRAEDSRNI